MQFKVPLFKRRSLWIGIGALVVVLVAVRFAAERGKQSSTLKPTTSATASSAVLELAPDDLAIAEKHDLRQFVRANGSLRPVNQATVKARVAGDIIAVLVREGETVRAGQVIARIDPTEFDWKAKQARANMMANQGQLDIATRSRDNNKALLEQGFISSTAYENAQGQFASAQANVEANSAALELAQKALADTQVRAPMNGTVATRNVDPGEKVSIDAPLFELVDLTALELEAAIPAAEITRVVVGQEVSIVPEGAAAPLSGRITRINPSSQPGSRSYLVYAQIASTPGAPNLRVGLFASATIKVAESKQVLAVPFGSVRQEGGGSHVYVLEGGRVVRKAVSTGFQGSENLIEITKGLVEGAQVIRANLGDLVEGPARVRVAKVAAAPAPAPAR